MTLRPSVIATCVIASGVAFHASLLLGGVWPLAWIAPVPVLWLAFRDTSARLAGVAAWTAYALGMANALPVYSGVLPPVALAIAVTAPSLVFALIVLGARAVSRRLSPLAGALAFALFWTAADYLASFDVNGTSISPAYSQVGVPVLIQGASVFGLWIVTFLLGAVSGGVAAGLAGRTVAPLALAIALFAGNAAFGYVRLASATSAATVRVGLVADSSLIREAVTPTAEAASRAIVAYSLVARDLRAQGATLIVFPEKVAILRPEWREGVLAGLQATASSSTTTVIGFDDRGVERRNTAVILPPGGGSPAVYVKRHLVPGLEDGFIVGHEPFARGDGLGVAICKDMDFQRTIRRDAAAHPTLLAVPAWDFEGDRWWHARLAVMRGVENGFAVARAANDGLLTVTDACGRLISSAATSRRGVVSIVADVPPGPGTTIYQRIGDVFAWMVLAGSALMAVAAARRRSWVN